MDVSENEVIEEFEELDELKELEESEELEELEDVSGNDLEFPILETEVVYVDYSETLDSINENLSSINSVLGVLTFFLVGTWLWSKARAIAINLFGGERNV